MPDPVSLSTNADPPYIRAGFRWSEADAYLFDIDGTLLNCQDMVHFSAFHNAFREVLGLDANLNGLVLHGNTDIGILKAALKREGFASGFIDSQIPRIVKRMCAEVCHNRELLRPQLCPSINELISCLTMQRKLLGAASGNLEPIGWMKLEKAGLKQALSFGSFAWPREFRAEIFKHGISTARRRLGSSARVCVIGDTPADVHAARAVGAPVIAMSTGIYDFSELRACNPDACCASAADLLAIS